MITRGRRVVTALDEEDSARPAAVGELLEFAAAQAPARRYGIFLVGHGGLMGRYGYDGFVSGEEAPRWMELAQASAALADFDATDPGRVELLHLQQCGRASAETLYDVRDAAPVVLASQAWLGAPNSYYHGAIALLSAEPDAGGRDLALAVMGHDAPEMFMDYVAVRTEGLADLPHALDVAVAPLDAVGDGDLPPMTVTYRWGEDRLVDLDALLTALYRRQAVTDDAPLRRLRRFLADQVIIARRARPAAEGWSGLSVLAPTAGSLHRHADRTLFTDSRLGDLHP